jgi:hypothetical protein
VFVGVFTFVGVGVEVWTGVGIAGDHQAVERRALPSSGSTVIDAFLLDRRPESRRPLCSWCHFIVLFPCDVTSRYPKPT